MDEGECDTTDDVDSYGDGCEWYVDYPDGCGNYDTETFSADDMCCACMDECEDGEGVDTYGDGCDWYDANPDGCGGYDWEEFTAADECCACQ